MIGRMNKVDPRIKEDIIKSGLYVMRDKWTNKALGIAFQEEGFKFKANKMGKVPYFKNARLTVN